MEIKTLHTIDTEYPADTIEWCPNPNYLEYFVCGTYELEESNTETLTSSPPCRRKGRIYLFRYNIENNSVKEIDRLETAAILDMKWLNESTEIPILSSANALGQIEIYLLQNDQLILKFKNDLNTNDHNLLTLSLDWILKEGETANLNKIITSDSKGDITLFDCNNDLKKISSWSAHNFEAWICTADKWNYNNIFTGGDDTFMHQFDIRAPDILKIYTNKSHIAGVTCLLSHPIKKNILLTGSYDERLRIFDTRFLKNSLTELNLNGGIWRIKSDPKMGNLILCACMYHNFSILHIDNDCKEINLVGEYNEHDSICYGADWCNLKNDKLIMATCSFYDHKLCISNIVE